ncbi:MAG: hypothetical protein R2882_02525 [Gemmatimonadales bacterium]
MRHFWLFVHLAGFTVWLGGALAAMTLGIMLRREPRDQVAAWVRALGAIYRFLILPGCLAATVSGLVLTLIMYGGPAAAAGVSHYLMAMQGTGVLAAVITLVFLVPNAGKQMRVDPVSQAPLFDALRAKQARFGMISGVLGLIALLTGALGRP